MWNLILMLRIMQKISFNTMWQVDCLNMVDKRQTRLWSLCKKKRRVQICICECIYELMERLPAGCMYLWALVSLIVLARFQWIFNALREGLHRIQKPRRKGGQRESVHANLHSHKHTASRVKAHVCGCVQIHRPAAVGGERSSDKQLCCYKGGRKSIKRDNKIAIEFL